MTNKQTDTNGLVVIQKQLADALTHAIAGNERAAEHALELAGQIEIKGRRTRLAAEALIAAQNEVCSAILGL